MVWYCCQSIGLSGWRIITWHDLHLSMWLSYFIYHPLPIIIIFIYFLQIAENPQKHSSILPTFCPGGQDAWVQGLQGADWASPGAVECLPWMAGGNELWIRGGERAEAGAEERWEWGEGGDWSWGVGRVGGDWSWGGRGRVGGDWS